MTYNPGYMADADPIQGARGIRVSPAQIAALANASMAALGDDASAPQPDLNAGLGTHSGHGVLGMFKEDKDPEAGAPINVTVVSYARKSHRNVKKTDKNVIRSSPWPKA
jgi:hypothetical protein